MIGKLEFTSIGHCPNGHSWYIDDYIICPVCHAESLRSFPLSVAEISDMVTEYDRKIEE
jgi:hypothetical protein